MSSKNNPVADLTIKEATGLAIEYAHLKYSNNQNWNEIYQNSLVGTLEVDRYQEYKFENYTVQPENSQSLYIINKEGALTFSNDKRPGQGSVTFGDTQQELGHVNLQTVYTTVKKQGKLSIAKKISKNMNLETQWLPKVTSRVVLKHSNLCNLMLQENRANQTMITEIFNPFLFHRNYKELGMRLDYLPQN